MSLDAARFGTLEATDLTPGPHPICRLSPRRMPHAHETPPLCSISAPPLLHLRSTSAHTPYNWSTRCLSPPSPPPSAPSPHSTPASRTPCGPQTCPRSAPAQHARAARPYDSAHVPQQCPSELPPPPAHRCCVICALSSLARHACICTYHTSPLSRAKRPPLPPATASPLSSFSVNGANPTAPALLPPPSPPLTPVTPHVSMLRTLRPCGPCFLAGQPVLYRAWVPFKRGYGFHLSIGTRSVCCRAGLSMTPEPSLWLTTASSLHLGGFDAPDM